MRTPKHIASNKITFILFNSVLSPRIQLLVKSLADNGWNVTVVAWDRYDWSFSDKELLAKVENIYYVDLPMGKGLWSKVTILPRLYRELKYRIDKAGKADLYFITHLMLLPVARNLPGKVIYEVAEYYVVGLAEYFEFIRKFAQTALLYFESIFLKHIDAVLTVDSADAWLFKYFKKEVNKVQVLWNLPSLKDDPSENVVESLKRKYKGRKVVAYVGGLLPEKGLIQIIDVAVKVSETYPNVLFMLIGPLPDQHKYILHKINKYNLESNFKFLPPMPYKEMMGYLMCADIGLALYQKTNRYELLGAGNGRKLFSYMQAGIAIIAPNFGMLGQVVEKSDCGVIVDTEKVDEIVKSVIYYLDQDEVSDLAGAKGRRFFEERYNWETQENEFLSFVNNIFE